MHYLTQEVVVSDAHSVYAISRFQHLQSYGCTRRSSEWASDILRHIVSLASLCPGARQHTWTVFPPLLLHEMAQFQGSVTGMWRSAYLDGTRACLAPDMITAAQWTHNDVLLIELVLIHEHSFLASADTISTQAHSSICEIHTVCSAEGQRKKPTRAP